MLFLNLLFPKIICSADIFGKVSASRLFLHHGKLVRVTMRASDMVRGKISTPVSIIKGCGDKALAGQIPGQTHGDDTLFATRGKSIFNSAALYIQEVRKRQFSSGEPLDLKQPLRLIGQMTAEPSLVDEMYQYTLPVGENGDFEIFSSVNTMIYCFKIGVRMGYGPDKLTEICLAALHYDIGMFLISEAITGKPGELTAAEWTEVRKHPEKNRELLKSYDDSSPNLSRVCYEHHERESGQGYPLGIKGEAISEYAKIIGICDTYEAMTHNRPYRKAAAQYFSILKLIETKDLFFATHVMKAFLDEFTMYPAGSYVRLNNKAIGIVVRPNRKNPFKPTVRLISDGQGSRILDEKMIDLADTAILNIVAGISAEEAPK